MVLSNFQLVRNTPELRPVNYMVYRSRIVIRTDRGLLFEAARQEKAASLAVTSFDTEKRTAWSVIVKGTLEQAMRLRKPPGTGWQND